MTPTNGDPIKHRSHPFGDLISQHLSRKHGLTQSKLAEGIMQDPAVISAMCHGRRLTGSQARERVVQIIDWFYEQEVLSTQAEANALLEAAGMSSLSPDQPQEAKLLELLTDEEDEDPVSSPPPESNRLYWPYVLGGLFLIVGSVVILLTSLSRPSCNRAEAILGKAICEIYSSCPNCNMALIPEGPFEMGGDADVALAECEKFAPEVGCQRYWFEDEEPIHTVTLDAFYIDQYEVSNAQYDVCVNAGHCTRPSRSTSFSRNDYYGNPQYDDYPVIWVDWEQAKTYCEWRGARLPTEAEWEKAARGTEGRLYPWGNRFDAGKANFCDKNCDFDYANLNYNDGYKEIAPVDAYAEGASPPDINNMGGNVW